MSSAAAQPLLDKLAPLHEAAVAEGTKRFAELPVATRKKLKEPTINPIATPHYDEEENETGDVLFKFGMTASGISKKTGKAWTRKPAVFDATRKPMDGNKVWGGTVGKVAFTTSPYFVDGTGAVGLSLRLEGVQVLELVSGGQRTGASMGFEEEEGYTSGDADDNSAESGEDHKAESDF